MIAAYCLALWQVQDDTRGHPPPSPSPPLLQSCVRILRLAPPPLLQSCVRTLHLALPTTLRLSALSDILSLLSDPSERFTEISLRVDDGELFQMVATLRSLIVSGLGPIKTGNLEGVQRWEEEDYFGIFEPLFDGSLGGKLVISSVISRPRDFDPGTTCYKTPGWFRPRNQPTLKGPVGSGVETHRCQTQRMVHGRDLTH